ncbi:MAG: hypothetical protein AUG03_02900 [Acidobacteria bacterium 13_1_20CM_2_68_14]|nr:MAG: hypothetical protein AUG03_02900 [Acidobacteria bacterium 13_1_20CM_2_68_14]
MDGVAEIRGRLKALSCADVLEFLRVLNRAGLLSLTSAGASIGLYLRGGRVVHATSTRVTDRLSECLVQAGLITREQCGEAMRRAAGGEKLGRALLGSGGLTPRGLMEARQRLVRGIATSLFEWEEGEFVFLEGEAPPDAEVEVDLSITELLLEGIRSVRDLALFRKRMPFDDWVFERIPRDGPQAEVGLEAHEAYLLRLVDGTRSVGQIGALSEFGPEESLRTLFLLCVVGRLKMKARVSEEVEADTVDGVDGILRRYNGMFGMVYQYLMKEVGPISEHLLSRSLRELSAAHPALFHRASLGGDGTVDAGLLRENLSALASRRRRETLIHGLNELLYSELLVLRKTLGPDHEGRVLRAFREVRLREPGAGGV